MRIGVVGDVHSNSSWLVHCIRQLAPHCDAFVQVGDFGWWPKFDHGVVFLDTIQQELEDWDKVLYWIDGNHEDHDSIAEDLTEIDDQGFRFADRWSRLRHIPRGHVWSWEGKTFTGVGGAVSVDHAYRQMGYNLFEAETLYLHQIRHLMSDVKVDVMFSHDAPVEVYLQSSIQVDWFTGHRAEQCRQLIQKVVEATRPDLVVHGHWHQSRRCYLRGGRTLIRSLACDGTDFAKERSWAVYDTETSKLVSYGELFAQGLVV